MATRAELYEWARLANAEGDEEAFDRFMTRIHSGEFGDSESLPQVEETNWKTRGKALAQGVGQGATFGFLDELGAMSRTMFDPMVGGLLAGLGAGNYQKGDSFGERMRNYMQDYTAAGDLTAAEAYQENLQSQRDAYEQAKDQHSNITLGGEILGGLATGIPLGAGATASRSGLRAIGRGGAAGMFSGGLAGAGYSDAENLNELREDVGRGAAFGGVLGAAFPAAAALGRSAVRGVSHNFGRGQAHVERRAADELIERVNTDLAQSGKSVDDFAREMVDDPSLTWFDTGREMKHLAAEISSLGEGRQPSTLRDYFTKTRPLEIPDQIEDAFRKGMKLPPASGSRQIGGMQFEKQAADRVNEMRDIGEALYEGYAYKIPTRITARMGDILGKTKIGKFAYRNAQDYIDGEIPMRDMPTGGVGTMARTDVLHAMTQAMDDYVNRLFKQGKSGLGFKQKAVAKRFKDEILKSNDRMREANAIWRNQKELDEAVEAARDAFREGGAVNARKIKEMSQTARLAHKAALAEEFRNRVGTKNVSGDITKAIREQPKMRDIIRVAFGSKKRFADFMDSMYKQQGKAETTAYVNRGVSGDLRAPPGLTQEATGALGTLVGSKLGNLVGSNELLMAGAGRRAVTRALPHLNYSQNTYDQLARMGMGGPGMASQLNATGFMTMPQMPGAIPVTPAPVMGLLAGRDY